MDHNVEYEKLTKEIYQALLAMQGITTIEVKHNVTIKGKAHKHQIDVFWEYEQAGIRNKVAIECKNYNRAVSKGAVTSFYGVLSDIGNINGIIVTRKGFQEGAKKFAEHYGINLRIIREPTAEDWNGRLKEMHTTINMIDTNVKKINTQIDKEWFLKNISSTVSDDQKFNLRGRNDEIWVKDKDGKLLKNFLQLQNELPHTWEPTMELSHVFEFENGYIDVEGIGTIKIKGIHFLYDVSVASSFMIFDAAEFTRAILKDVLTGELKFFNKDGTIK